MPDLEQMRRRLDRFLRGTNYVEWVPACRSCWQRPGDFDNLYSRCWLFVGLPGDRPPGERR